MRFIRASEITTPSATGSAPPDRPVPAPRATNGTPCSWQSRTTAATCSAVSGRTTSSGIARQPVSASHSYTRSCSGSAITASGGSSAPIEARNASGRGMPRA